jgi:hypothetical protein
MAFPSSHSAPGSGPLPRGAQPPAHAAQPPAHGAEPIANGGEHTLEKLEFALAVALTRGDGPRSQSLREQIAALGGNQEEPGT